MGKENGALKESECAAAGKHLARQGKRSKAAGIVRISMQRCAQATTGKCAVYPREQSRVLEKKEKALGKPRA
jgi:hypothetical protein